MKKTKDFFASLKKSYKEKIMRVSEITRTTKETDISVKINLDACDKTKINTGVGFFDHMLTALSVHSGIGMEISCKGDLYVDCHHTIEDVGIVLGKAFNEAVFSKTGITRYGSAQIPMDEALAMATLDISNRPYLVFNASFTSDKTGDFDNQMCEEFFRAFAFNAGITLHINLMYGTNDHHKLEGIFKAVAHALKIAIKLNGDKDLSTKGVI